jgi:hypothetical protein
MPLLKLFLDICLFRKGPQDAPASPALLKLALSAYFLVGLLLAILEAHWLEGILQVLLEAAMLLGFAWASLMAAGKTSRWLQTAIAMLGTDALVSSFAIPLDAVLLASPQAGLLHLLLLLLMLWHIAVVAHILRHALSQALAVGLGLSIAYVFFSVQVLILLFGPPTASG